MPPKKNAGVDAPRKRGRPRKMELSVVQPAHRSSNRAPARSKFAKTSSVKKSRRSRPKSEAAPPEQEAILAAHQPRIAPLIPPPPEPEIPVPPPPEPESAPPQIEAEHSAFSGEIESLRLRKLTLMVAAPPRMAASMFGWRAFDLSDIQARSIVDAWDASFPGLLDGLDRLALVKWLAVACATLA